MSSRILFLRPQCVRIVPRLPAQQTAFALRNYSSGKEQPKGLNQDPLPHVSEEAAAIAKVTGQVSPEIEQGTPIEEVLPYCELTRPSRR